jgi:hypothetical protein
MRRRYWFCCGKCGKRWGRYITAPLFSLFAFVPKEKCTKCGNLVHSHRSDEGKQTVP